MKIQNHTFFKSKKQNDKLQSREDPLGKGRDKYANKCGGKKRIAGYATNVGRIVVCAIMQL